MALSHDTLGMCGAASGFGCTVDLSFLTRLRDAPGPLDWMNPQEKLIQFASPFINYLFPLDMITAALLYGGVALGIALGFLRLRHAPQWRLPPLRSCTLLPFNLMSAAFVDTRFAITFGFLPFAATEPTSLTPQMRSISLSD